VRRAQALQQRASRARISVLAPNSGASEAYRILRTGLQFSGFGAKSRTLLVTSTGPGDGKSNTLANLAVVFAGTGERTLIVDAETRKAGVDSLFGLENAPGLTDLLVASGDGNPEEIARVIHRTGIPNLDLLPSGTRAANSGNALSISTVRLRELLGKLKQDYRFVLLDAPPLLIVHETLFIASIVDSVVLVINSAHPEVGRLLEAKGLLESAGVTVMGAVLNHVELQGIYRTNSYYGLQPETSHT
jgi:capsular exopolysaccharide synthesis family protein